MSAGFGFIVCSTTRSAPQLDKWEAPDGGRHAHLRIGDLVVMFESEAEALALALILEDAAYYLRGPNPFVPAEDTHDGAADYAVR